MKKTNIILLLLIFVFFWTSISDASWIIDPEKYHVSAHREFACVDCHDNIPDKELHPDPSEVNMEPGDFFNEDRCYMCHDNVPDDIEEGMHGNEELDPGISYDNCLECHNPHETPGSDAMSDGYDPSKSPQSQCIICHGEHPGSLPASPDNENCMTCHGQTAAPDSHASADNVLCFSCHADDKILARAELGDAFNVISKDSYNNTPHAALSCGECHKNADQYPHNDQDRTACLECHTRHDEKVAHDMHALVSCEACHIQSAKPVKDPESKKIIWELDKVLAASVPVHDMFIDDESCVKCHFRDNTIGAAAMVLPAKGILCMPCHASTFSVSHPATFIFLLIFIAGFISLFSIWLSGSFKGKARNGKAANLVTLIKEIFKAVFSRRITAVIRSVIIDVLLQRRLFIQSRTRWAIHSLIFIPFVFRFIWGLTALLASLWFPEGNTAWALIDKNAPAAALLFDISGIMILTGIILAFIRGTRKNRERLQALPQQDKAALILIGLIVIAGFILEGIRIAMTGRPDNSGFAFIGYLISNMFSSPTAAVNIYGPVWYIHAVISGIFIAYLPFSRLLHIIIGPFILAANAAAGKKY